MEIFKDKMLTYLNMIPTNTVNQPTNVNHLNMNQPNDLNQQNNMNQQNCMSQQNTLSQPNMQSQITNDHCIPTNCPDRSTRHGDGEPKQGTKKLINQQTNMRHLNMNQPNDLNQQNCMTQQNAISQANMQSQITNDHCIPTNCPDRLAGLSSGGEPKQGTKKLINQTTNVSHLNMNQPNDTNQQNSMNQQNNMNQQNCMAQQNVVSQPNTQSQITSDQCIPTNSPDRSSGVNDDGEPKQGTKKGRKIKSNKSQWRKEKGNKYLNKPYRNYKGVEIKSKEFLDYDCQCMMKCKEILSASEREQEFQKFWELGSYEAQAIFLIARVDEQTTKKSAKRKKDKKGDKDDDSSGSEGKKSKRQFSRTYILKSKQVCRDMFVKTLGITSKRINTALVKMRAKSLIDNRGLSQGGKNKISDKRYDEVVDHIKKMPRYKCSHMQGKYDNDYLSLPPELSLSKMYDLYSKEVEQPVSLSMYKKIYYGKFNFKAKGVKREVCNICKGDRKLKNAEMKKQQTMEKLSLHCPSNQMMLQDQYRAPNFVPPPPINCNQSWLPAPNFQMPQHIPTHYFDQPMVYDMN